MKKLYWKMYQNKESMKGTSVIITQDEMIKEVNWVYNNISEDEDMPVFEPVFITEKEFKELPEFDGF